MSCDLNVSIFFGGKKPHVGVIFIYYIFYNAVWSKRIQEFNRVGMKHANKNIS